MLRRAPPLQHWLDDALVAARELRPRVVVATTMHHIAGAWLIPALLRRGGAPHAREPAAGGARPAGPQYVVAHTVLSTPTGGYAPATAAVGQTLPFAFLNR